MANHDKFCPQGEDGLRTDAYCLCEYFDDVRHDQKQTIIKTINQKIDKLQTIENPERAGIIHGLQTATWLIEGNQP
jgi:hypothetical protein